MIPYGKQSIDADDIRSVVEVLQSDWLTTGPKVHEFEKAFADRVGAKHAVAVSSGTAALHASMFALGIHAQDEVIVPTVTFAATANCVVFQGGTPVFADVESRTILIDPLSVESRITSKTKAIIAMDYAGQPCDYDTLAAIAERHHLALVADACHSLGAYYKGRPVGSLALLNAFSFHPVKHITTGEGGMITTDDSKLAEKMRLFRNHGITTDHREREAQGSWFYEMIDLGYNYRITDFQCALGISQLNRLPQWVERRREIAFRYNEAFNDMSHVKPLSVQNEIYHAYHLYVVRVGDNCATQDRKEIFRKFREEGIGVNVHYIPVHLHPFYQKSFNTTPGLCPIAEEAYKQIFSLPIFPAMTDKEVDAVIDVCMKIIPK
ncbi:MAG: UDP-4-amino-4,6-dideoxy-N-acetyl-beta-L-altrosamine transaminase [Syntrophales bacterium]